MRIHNQSLTLTSTDMSQTSLSSRGVWLGHIADFSIQLVFTGSPVGTFKLQASNDIGQEDKQGNGWSDTGVSHWTDISNSSVAVSAAGDLMYNYRDCGYRWVRLVYTKDSGTGTITSAKINLKGI